MENYLTRLHQIWGDQHDNPRHALDWIEKTVERKAEEGLYLDFKQKSVNREPALNDNDKANLAKAISGFANSDGGLVIWGVKAKTETKDDPDVAVELVPVSNLKTFQTWLNAISGELVVPPVAGVENRIVPSAPGVDTGYVVTIVPKRRDTLVQANAKTCKGFYIRSGSGFHQLPEPLIAEFYRKKPSPLLRLGLQLSDPDQAQFVEEIVEAENSKEVRTTIRSSKRSPWGRCLFRQSLAIQWHAVLGNEGLGSANDVAINLEISTSHTWSIVDFEVEKSFYTTPSFHKVPIYSPVPLTKFRAVDRSDALGRVLEAIHPGQRIQVASGILHITFAPPQEQQTDFEVSGFAFAADSQPFPLSWRMEGSELHSRYVQAFHKLAESHGDPVRILPEPAGAPLFNFNLDD
ncbi:MAG: ATP-binding protein [Armatimonadetes bacterium]|nr:ATP-binding protein [Armatimonadota bacterium]